VGFKIGDCPYYSGKIADKYKNALRLADRFIGGRLEEMQKIYKNFDEYIQIYQESHDGGTIQDGNA
jgi:hypothetical protein